MKQLHFIFLGLLVALSVGCIKEPEEIIGCTDPDALTYNPNATSSNNNLCYYQADSYAGSWFAVETVWEYDNLSGDSIASLQDYFFRITVDRLPDDVFLLGFAGCSDTLMGGASNEVLTVSDGSPCGLSNFALDREASELAWDFRYNAGQFSYRRRGNAVRN